MKGAALAHHQGEAIQLLRKRTGPELQDLGNIVVRSAFTAAISRAASGEASVLRRMYTVPTLEIVAPVAASLRPTAATKRSCLLTRNRRRSGARRARVLSRASSVCRAAGYCVGVHTSFRKSSTRRMFLNEPTTLTFLPSRRSPHSPNSSLISFGCGVPKATG
jgi:hypothetical protein